VFEASLADQKAGGQGGDPTYTCIPPGMPRAMTVVFPMEIVVLPNVTYILQEYASMIRRIYTDGRTIPDDEEPAFLGYSVGQWRDTDGDGKFDYAGGRNPQHERPALVRCERPAVAPGQQGRRQGAHLSRQGQQGPAARRDHHHPTTRWRSRGRS